MDGNVKLRKIHCNRIKKLKRCIPTYDKMIHPKLICIKKTKLKSKNEFEIIVKSSSTN